MTSEEQRRRRGQGFNNSVESRREKAEGAATPSAAGLVDSNSTVGLDEATKQKVRKSLGVSEGERVTGATLGEGNAQIQTYSTSKKIKVDFVNGEWVEDRSAYEAVAASLHGRIRQSNHPNGFPEEVAFDIPANANLRDTLDNILQNTNIGKLLLALMEVTKDAYKITGLGTDASNETATFKIEKNEATEALLNDIQAGTPITSQKLFDFISSLRGVSSADVVEDKLKALNTADTTSVPAGATSKALITGQIALATEVNRRVQRVEDQAVQARDEEKKELDEQISKLENDAKLGKEIILGDTRYKTDKKRKKETAIEAIATYKAGRLTEIEAKRKKAVNDEKQKYADFLGNPNINNDPNALKILDFVGENISNPDTRKVSKVMADINGRPKLESLMKSGKVDYRQYQKLINTLETTSTPSDGAAQVEALLNSGVTDDSLAKFAGAGDDSLALLKEMKSQNLTNTNTQINEVADNINAIKSRIGSPQARTDFVKLLKHQSPVSVTEAANMLQSLPDGVDASYLLGLKNANANSTLSSTDLSSALNLSQKLSMDANQLMMAFTNNTNLTTIKNQLGRVALHNVDKKNSFRIWVARLNVMLSDPDATFTISNTAGPHPAGANTIEYQFTVTDNNGNTISNTNQTPDWKNNQTQSTFVLHYHPGAQGSSVQATNSSRAHLKTEPGSDVKVRMYGEEVPVKLKQEVNRLIGSNLLRTT